MHGDFQSQASGFEAIGRRVRLPLLLSPGLIMLWAMPKQVDPKFRLRSSSGNAHRDLGSSSFSLEEGIDGL